MEFYKETLFVIIGILKGLFSNVFINTSLLTFKANNPNPESCILLKNTVDTQMCHYLFVLLYICFKIITMFT